MKHILILLAAFCAFGALCFIGIFALNSVLPPHDSIQVNRLQMSTGEHSIITLTADTDEGYYAILPSADFANSFAFDTWETCEKQWGAEVLFTLQLGPNITLTFSPDGYVAAKTSSFVVSRGSKVTSPNVYYAISPTTTNNILSYIQEYGTPQT